MLVSAHGRFMPPVSLLVTPLAGHCDAENPSMVSLWHAGPGMQQLKGVIRAAVRRDKACEEDWRSMPGMPGGLSVHSHQQCPQGGAGWEECAAW